MTATRVVSVVVDVEPFHLDRPFEYQVPDGMAVDVGQRVQVGFAGRRVRGLVVGTADEPTVAQARIKPVIRVLGEHVWVRPDELDVLRWAAARFGAPLAHVLRHALPNRTIDVERRAAAAGWYPPGSAHRPRSDPPPEPEVLRAGFGAYGATGNALVDAVRGSSGSFLWRPLPGEDLGARLAELTQLALANDRDVLLVVPDPCSPAADAVVRAAGDLVVDLRGGPSPRVVYRRWLEARCGRARVVVGERGAAFTPLDRLGLAIVLDEANPAFKERRSPRHHAREVVLERARRAGGVGVAVGVVPSAVAWRLLREQRLTPVVADREVERRARPRVRVVTGDDQPRARLLRESTAAIRSAVDGGTYAVVLAALRGEGRALVCSACNERVVCPDCGSSIAIADDRVVCEGCGWHASRRRRCPACGGSGVTPLAAGARRLADELRRAMDTPVEVMEGYGQPAPPAPAVLVMTRGSALDTPPGPVGAVVIPDIDGALRRPSLDAAEDALRLACVVAGWTVHAGRQPPGLDVQDLQRQGLRPEDRRGWEPVVVVQTREPQHHAITALAAWDPGAFWRTEVSIRAQLRFPPVANAIRVSVAMPKATDRATISAATEEIVATIAGRLPAGDDVLGPFASDGRQTLLIKSDDRDATLTSLTPLRTAASRAGVDVRVDVDPVDAW